MRAAAAALLVTLLAVAAPATAQHTEDEQTEEHRRRDEEYLRRLARPEAEAPPATPDADPAASKAAFLALAEQLVRDRNYRAHDSEHYRVQTDDPRIDARAVAALLESFRSFFDRRWAAGRPPGDGEPARVFLFYSYHDYDRLLEGDWSRSVVRPKGHYGSSIGAIVVHTDSDRPGGLANTLVHEAAHQLVDDRLLAGNGRTSPWAGEGLATYYEHTLLDKEGRFQDGVIGGKHVAVLRGEAGRAKSDARQRIAAAGDRLRRAARDGTPLLARLADSGDPSAFYGPDALARYDLAWMLVHWLLHGEDGARAEALASHLQAETGGGAPPLLETLGLDAAALDAAVLAHIKELEVR